MVPFFTRYGMGRNCSKRILQFVGLAILRMGTASIEYVELFLNSCRNCLLSTKAPACKTATEAETCCDIQDFEVWYSLTVEVKP
jgi:hypothetical protein